MSHAQARADVLSILPPYVERRGQDSGLLYQNTSDDGVGRLLLWFQRQQSPLHPRNAVERKSPPRRTGVSRLSRTSDAAV
jgi:hypothetical protein